MPKERRKDSTAAPNPMDEENFPERSPTRDAVEREMQEPSNVRGPMHPVPKRAPPHQEAGSESTDEPTNE